MIHRQTLAIPKLTEMFMAIQFELLYLTLDMQSIDRQSPLIHPGGGVATLVTNVPL